MKTEGNFTRCSIYTVEDSWSAILIVPFKVRHATISSPDFIYLLLFWIFNKGKIASNPYGRCINSFRIVPSIAPLFSLSQVLLSSPSIQNKSPLEYRIPEDK